MKSLSEAAKYGAVVFACLTLSCLCRSAPVAAQVEPPTSVEKKSSSDRADAENKAASSADPWASLRSWSLSGFVTAVREHGLSVVVIVLLAAGVLWLANRLHKRLVALLAGGATRGNVAEQENRARTLVGVLHNALRTAVISLAAIMVLEEIGVKVSALLGGVAVAGLAVAFGAQSLIKDYFTGFLVLLEQQYMIGDMVKISGITGQVEQITLRVTVLRDLEGAVHFIPHGQINMVSNLTHGWSQAVFDLSVPREESIERVCELFFELARELRGDSNFGPMILNDPQRLGVDSLGDATFTIKFALKTLPLKRWEVKREMLRRIKERFQDEKIKVSVPG